MLELSVYYTMQFIEQNMTRFQYVILQKIYGTRSKAHMKEQAR